MSGRRASDNPTLPVPAPPAEAPAPVAPAPAAPPRRRWPVVVTLLLGPVLFAISAFLARAFHDAVRQEVVIPWAVLVLLAVAIALCAAGTTVHVRARWIVPARRLRTYLDDLRAGPAPIGELTQITGGLAPLTDPLRDLIRELRISRVQAARLDGELKQRVAQRTDALERTIGSLRQQAIKDPLTGLHNRRVLPQTLAAMLAGAAPTNADLCVVAIDVDHFKQLNDTLGHPAGDDLLRSIGQLIKSTIRADDLAFRCGGDEFVLLLADTTAAAAATLGQRLATLVDGLVRPLRLATPPRLSIGVASRLQVSDPTADNLLAEADRKLYEVKTAHHAERGTPNRKSRRPAA